MDVQQQVSLKQFNTFGIDVKAAYMAAFSSVEELSGLLSNHSYKNLPVLILGGGSNVLFTKDFEGIVLRNNIPGIQIINESKDSVLVKAGSGVVWHNLVTWCIDQGLGGIENLSLIPGKSGAAPIQNIGAYGVELKDSFESLEAYHKINRELITFTKRECEFGYRDSVFKRHLKDHFVITSITLSLTRSPQLHLTYGAIEQELQKMGVEKPDVKMVSQAVCNIRRSKLPDPVQIGNAGSFFKNPEISNSQFEKLKSDFPGIVAYALPDGNVKLAAGWMIEQCGWKGKVVGNTGAHVNQALVLVNYGQATGNEIRELAKMIQASVLDKFGVTIEPEVNII